MGLFLFVILTVSSILLSAYSEKKYRLYGNADWMQYTMTHSCWAAWLVLASIPLLFSICEIIMVRVVIAKVFLLFILVTMTMEFGLILKATKSIEEEKRDEVKVVDVNWNCKINHNQSEQLLPMGWQFEDMNS